MEYPVRSEILRKLGRYLKGADTLREFRDWFSPIAWNIEVSGDQQTIDLAYLVDGLLAESTSGGWPEFGLKKELAAAIRPFVLHPQNNPKTRRPEIAIQSMPSRGAGQFRWGVLALALAK